MEAALKQIEDDRFWPIPDMAQEMRVEHDRLAQLGWVYDGFGGYRKKSASSPAPKPAPSNLESHGRPSRRVSDEVARSPQPIASSPTRFPRP